MFLLHVSGPITHVNPSNKNNLKVCKYFACVLIRYPTLPYLRGSRCRDGERVSLVSPRVCYGHESQDWRLIIWALSCNFGGAHGIYALQTSRQKGKQERISAGMYVNRKRGGKQVGRQLCRQEERQTSKQASTHTQQRGKPARSTDAIHSAKLAGVSHCLSILPLQIRKDFIF